MWQRFDPARSAKISRASPRSVSTPCASFCAGPISSPSPDTLDPAMLARLEAVADVAATRGPAHDADAVLRAHERRQLAAGVVARPGHTRRALPHDHRARRIAATASATFTPVRCSRRSCASRARRANGCARIRRCWLGIWATSSATCASRRASTMPPMWSRRLTAALEETLGDRRDRRDARRRSHARPPAAPVIVVRAVAFATMHGYRVYSAFARDASTPACAVSAPLTAASFARKPRALQRVRQPDVSAGQALAVRARPAARRTSSTRYPPTIPRAPYACLNEDEMAGYCTAGARAASCRRRLGAYWWCWADYAAELAGEPPFDRAPHEMSFGIIRDDGSEKPVAAAPARFAAERRNVRARCLRSMKPPTISICPTAPPPRTRAGSRNAAAARGKRARCARTRCKQRLAAGETVVGMWLSLSEPLAAEALASLGWDWLLIDMEHGPFRWRTAAAMVDRDSRAAARSRSCGRRGTKARRSSACSIWAPMGSSSRSSTRPTTRARSFATRASFRSASAAAAACAPTSPSTPTRHVRCARERRSARVCVQIETETAVANAEEIARSTASTASSSAPTI